MAVSSRDSRPAWGAGRRIAGPAEVSRVLAAVNESGAARAVTAAALRSVSRADGVGALQPEPVLPVHPLLRALLPWQGLRRGATVAAVGSHSMLLALLGGVSAAGSWCAVVGMPTLGLVAAAEHGVELSRLALVPEPRPGWADVVAALIDGSELVAVSTPTAVSDATSRVLTARARRSGCVLVPRARGRGATWCCGKPRSSGTAWAAVTAGCGSWT
jgi:hypothetical protein